MRAVREPPAYRYTQPAGYGSGMSRRNGPVRRRFAVLAVACSMLTAGTILALTLVAQALATGGF